MELGLKYILYIKCIIGVNMLRFHLILLFLVNISFAQQIAQTENGTKVILNKDGTWQYFKNSTKKSNSNETQVFVTYTGKKYHKSGCRYLKSKIPSTVSKAQSNGLTACKVCKPASGLNYNTPIPIKKNVKAPDYTSSRCSATTQKGSRCKRNAQSGGVYCWQHP